MSEFEVGDRVKHSARDLENGYFKGDHKGLGTVYRLSEGYVWVLWDNDPETGKPVSGGWHAPHLDEELVMVP